MFVVNYYLVYRTSETSYRIIKMVKLVNYCLVYRTSETKQ